MASKKLLNDFLLGADPELILLNPPELVNGLKQLNPRQQIAGSTFYGFDHNGYVVEPHPTPSFSAREVCRNIKSSLDVIVHQFPNFKHRAGAYYRATQRTVTLGGHVHLDLPSLSTVQLKAMDVFCQSLEDLDILPAEESSARASRGDYGRKSDIRAEHGHVEYRSMCSWLFSRKTSMLCMTGIKLCAVAPKTLKLMQSVTELRNWIEGFKGADDDVDWILDRRYFDTSMVARPDTSVTSIWKADPEIGKTILENTPHPQAQTPLTVDELRSRAVEEVLANIWAAEEATRPTRFANQMQGELRGTGGQWGGLLGNV